MKLNIFWKKFYDPDTLDGKLKYEISWDEGANWKPASYLFDEIEGYRLTYELIAESGKTYSFWVRATDEWGLTEMLTGGWKTPTAAKNEEL